MSSTQGSSKGNLPVLQPQKACAHDSCSFSRNSTPHFHCPYCGTHAARKKPNILEHLKSKHGDMTTRTATSEVRQIKEEEAEKAQIKDGVTITMDKKKAKRKKKRKRNTDDHNDSEEEKEATAEHQGKLAKEYDSAVSLPRDVNDDRDEKEINRTKQEENYDSSSSHRVEEESELSDDHSTIFVESIPRPISDEREAERAQIKDGMTITTEKKKAKRKKKRKRKIDNHSDSEEEKEMEKAETKAEGTATNATNKARDDTRAICVDGEYDYALVFSCEEESDRPDVGEEDVESLHHKIQELERIDGNFVLDKLLLDIFKDFGYQSIMLQAMEDSVLQRTGCSFDILHSRVLSQQIYLESQDVEDFIENDSRYFQLSLEDNYKVELKSNVSCLQRSENMEDGDEVPLDLSNSYIRSSKDLVTKCERGRNASCAILTGSDISSKTWLFSVMEILCWFCPSLRRIDITGCKGFSGSNLTVGRYQSKIEIVDKYNHLLDPSVIPDYPDAGKEINELLAKKSISPRTSCKGWSLLHSAIFLGDTQLVIQIFEVMAKENGYENNNTEDDLMQTALELATALHKLDIIKLLRSQNVAYKDPSMLVQHCFLKELCFETFNHPVIEAVVSNEKALHAARTLHDTRQCDVASVLVALCENSYVEFKRKVFEEILRRVHSGLKSDCCLLFSCGNETAIRDFFKILMKEDKGLGHQRIDDFPCLMFSLQSLELIELLLNDGANIDDRDNLGCTALFHAVEKALATSTPYCFDLIKFLIDNKANPHVRNDVGDPLLLHSLTWCSRSCGLCETIMTHETLNSTLGEPFSVDHIVEVWRLLLSSGARGSVKDEMDRSLLHLLLKYLENGNIKSPTCRAMICTGLSFLQNGGLDVNARDAKGNTPLHYWANISNEISKDLIGIGRKLVLSGGAVNARNDKGETPLHFSQSWKQVNFLVREGAEADAKDLCGNTPLHKFIERGSLITDQVEEDRWKKCLASGMNPFSLNINCKCLFDVLLEKQFFKSALNLLKVIFESDVHEQLRKTARDHRNRAGDSLLHIACVVENTNASLICDYLLRNGWNANLVNTCHETPLFLACRNVQNVNSVLSSNIFLLRRYHADESISIVTEVHVKRCSPSIYVAFSIKQLRGSAFPTR